ncbi:MAG: hypothetical protein AB7O62_16235 [Pirellulales bacterium]
MNTHRIALVATLSALALITTAQAQAQQRTTRLTRTQAAAARAAQQGRFIGFNRNALGAPNARQANNNAPDLQPGDANGITRNNNTAPLIGPAFANPPADNTPPNGAVGVRDFGNDQGGDFGQPGNVGFGGNGSGQAFGPALPSASVGGFGSGFGGYGPGFGGGYYNNGGVFQDPYGYSAAGDYLHGQADLTRSAGAYNQSTAAAWSIAEDAYSKHLDNSKKYVRTYFERKAIHDSYVYPEKRQYRSHPSLDALNRERQANRGLNRKQFDDTFGIVYWPGILQESEYAAYRGEIENLMAERSTNDSGLGSKNCREIREVAEEMHQELKSHVKEMPSDEYMVALKFINGLKAEAAMPADYREQVAQD